MNYKKRKKKMKKFLLNTKKKAFTLIELLIVVAIIGILAGVGIPMYNGYMANAKIESTNTNHSNNKSFIAATLTRCSSGASTVLIDSAAVNCADADLKTAFINYFKDLNKNPYSASASFADTADPVCGQSGIQVTAKTYKLKTNVCNAAGGNSYKGPVTMTRE
jgi:type IV pilus assembly protein PilA